MLIERIQRLGTAILSVPWVVLQARRRYEGSLPGIGKKLLLATRRRYLPHEALYEGLLDPSLPDAAFDNRISRSRLSRLQEKLNPREWETLLADKSVFYRYCRVSGIPVPPVLGIFSRTGPGWIRTGSTIRTPDEWAQFFDGECRQDVVIKPSRGCHGEGIRFLHREDGRFTDQEGKSFSPHGLVEHLIADRDSPVFVIQERLENHEALVQFTGRRALQTIRMISVLHQQGEPVIAHAHLKMITGSRLFDNYGSGENENIMAEVNRESGELTEVLLTHGKPVPVHPISGQPIVGFRIPFWNEACALVKDSAWKFSPIGTIGWDVAVTPRGPVIIEGNIWYDPPSPRDITFFLSSLQEAHRHRPIPGQG